MFKKVLLKTVDGRQVRPEGFTIIDFPKLRNTRGFTGYPDVLFLSERVFVFDNSCKLPDGGNGAEYVETFAAAIVPIPDVDNNSWTEVEVNKSSEETGPAETDKPNKKKK